MYGKDFLWEDYIKEYGMPQYGDLIEAREGSAPREYAYRRFLFIGVQKAKDKNSPLIPFSSDAIIGINLKRMNRALTLIDGLYGAGVYFRKTNHPNYSKATKECERIIKTYHKPEGEFDYLNPERVRIYEENEAKISAMIKEVILTKTDIKHHTIYHNEENLIK